MDDGRAGVWRHLQLRILRIKVIKTIPSVSGRAPTEPGSFEKPWLAFVTKTQIHLTS